MKRVFCLLASLPLFLLANETQETYNEIVSAYHERNWREVVLESKLFEREFPEAEELSESTYLRAIAYYQLGEFDRANKALSDYLALDPEPRHLQETIALKFQIAERFREGAKCRLFVDKKFPKWFSGKDIALEIYEEVQLASGYHEWTWRSLLGKAQILAEQYEFKEAVDTLQQLIRRFPRTAAAKDAFFRIEEIYLKELQVNRREVDHLKLAKANVERFMQAFPSDEAVEQLQVIYGEIEEYFAKDLYDIARFYHRTGKEGAATLYYKKLLQDFPNSHAADKARPKLETAHELHFSRF